MQNKADWQNDFETDLPMKQRMTPKQRRARRRSKNKKRNLLVLLVLILVAIVCVFLFSKPDPFGKTDQNDGQFEGDVGSDIPSSTTDRVPEVEVTPPEEPEEIPFLHETEHTVFLDEDFPSEYVFLINADTGEILAEKNSYEFMNPASMTKVLTLLVAAEHIEDTSGTFTMTSEISEYCFTNECSVVGYIVGETVPIEELFYGCILCSGADASLALAELAAGSHEEFVKLMNDKVSELGLSEMAHFTNCVGIYDSAHGCTTADMALIMKAALENELCKQVLCTKTYSSVPTSEHPEGQALSNWFIRSLEDKDNGIVTPLGGKRGYVPQSGNCAVSYGETENGQSYICVTGRSYSQKQAIYDHAALYKEYCLY